MPATTAATQSDMVLDLLGVKTPLIDRGQGRPLLLVHGVPDSGAVWRPVIEKLGDGFRCIAPDLHGIGRSIAPPDFDLSLEGRAAWLDAVLEARGVDGPVDLACHDFGGPTALAWAVRHSERVRRLIIFGTCFHREWRWHWIGKAYQAPIVGDLIIAMQKAPVIGYRLFVNEMRRGSKGLPDHYLRECYANALAGDPRFILRLYRETPASLFIDWDSRLYELVQQRPTLCLWSDRDPYVPLEFAERLQAHGARLERFTDVGHWMMVEAADRVAEYLRNFLLDESPAD